MNRSASLTASGGGRRPRADVCADRRLVAEVLPGSTQSDFLKGDVENLSIDSQRPARCSARPPSWSTRPPRRSSGRSSPGADGSLFVGTGNEGKVFRIDAQGKGSLFFDAPSSKCTRWRRRPTAACTSARLPTARSTRSIATAQATTFFDPDDEVHLGARRRRERQRLRRHRRKGRHLQDHAGRQRRAVLQDEGDARDGAGVRQARQPARRHRVARAGAAGRPRRQGVRAARLAASRKSASLRFDDKGCSTSPR